MKQVWRCDTCGRIFDDSRKCSEHEISHLPCSEQKKAILSKCNYTGKEICDYCTHAFYVYGCEFDCQFKDRCTKKSYWPDFELDEKYSWMCVGTETGMSEDAKLEFVNKLKDKKYTTIEDAENICSLKLLSYQKELIKQFYYTHCKINKNGKLDYHDLRPIR